MLKTSLFRSAVRAPRALHWYHWVVIVFSLALTLTAWQVTLKQSHQKSKVQFQHQAKQLVALVQERMEKYEEALWAGVSALHMLDRPASRADWKVFADELRIESRFPGINGIGVIHYVPEEKVPTYLSWQREAMATYAMHPTRSGKEYWPITYIEPQQDNLKAVGLDMAHETNRYSAAQRAKSSGQASITGPIVLVQDSQRTPGFLFYVPWYRQGMETNQYGESGGDFQGLVYAPFVVYKLMDGTLDRSTRLVNFSIYDGDTELYSELNDRNRHYDADPTFSEQISLDLYGRTWVFHVQSSLLFKEQQSLSQPALILVFGLVVDVLLLVIFLMLSREKERAQQYADQVTHDLQLRTQTLEKVTADLEKRNHALEEANHELDQFAYVASHDLKAPLRGISQLVTWTIDDLKPHLTEQTEQYAALLQNRVSRLERLLDDLLLYSRVGRKQWSLDLFHVGNKIEEIFELLSPPPGINLEYDDQLGEISTLVTPLEMVLRNLMGNAIKHHDKAKGLIRVTATEIDDRYVFTVQDDGPGIPEAYQEKVFELFHTLQPRDKVEGSGLGLSIIKKTLDLYGCDYRLENNLEQGCTFRFSWPKQPYFAALTIERANPTVTP